MVPTAVMLLAAAAGLAWLERGSIAASDWLPYALLAGLLLTTLLLFSDITWPEPLFLAAFTALIALSVWTALTAAWSPVPSFARDEALLVSLYALSLAIPVLTLKTDEDRLIGVAAVAAVATAVAIATGVTLRFGGDPRDFYPGRLYFPISYVNAQSAFFLVGFWPALAIAARRSTPVVIRGTALGGATALLAGWLLTQSKGGGIALLVSAIAVFAFSSSRVRLLLPALVAGGLAAAAYTPLTAPFRAEGDADLLATIRDAGETLLWLALAGTVLGLAYAVVDHRLEISVRVRQAAGAAALLVLAGSLVLGAGTFLTRVDDPRDFAAEKWDVFKALPETQSRGSHLVTLGSNRYDFWRVSLNGFREHPVAGIGGRGFGPAYLTERRSVETPARAHSLPLDTMLETGVVGFVLLAAALVAALALVLSRRRGTVGVAALGGAVYFLVHASGDWVWTFPAVGVPVFVLVGIAASRGGGAGIVRPRVAVIAGVVALLATIGLYGPPWLSARLTAHALRTGDPEPLDLARRLDPLTIDPYLAEHALAGTPRERIAALERATELEPRSAALSYLLGLAYLNAGDRGPAREHLGLAHRLDPMSEAIAAALQRARA